MSHFWLERDGSMIRVYADRVDHPGDRGYDLINFRTDDGEPFRVTKDDLMFMPGAPMNWGVVVQEDAA